MFTNETLSELLILFLLILVNIRFILIRKIKYVYNTRNKYNKKTLINNNSNDSHEMNQNLIKF